MAFDFGKQNEDWNSQNNYGTTWPKGLLVFAFVFLFLVLGLKFGFDFLNAREQKIIDNYDTKISEAKKNFPVENQKTVLTFEKMVRNLKTLLDNRIKTSEFLANIAGSTHKEIYFVQFNTNIKENLIEITGVAKNLSIVTQTVSTFEKMQGVERVEVKNTRNASDSITFTINLIVNSSFFK